LRGRGDHDAARRHGFQHGPGQDKRTGKINVCG
jgi:hypothetical protein